jgi:hypothetical protein
MKKMIIFACLLLLTGCNATYEITIKDNKIKEKLTLVELDQSKFDLENDSGWTLRELFKTQLEVSKDEFSIQSYTVKDLSSDNKLGLEYKLNSSKELINLSAINQCYTNPIIEIEDRVINFSTGSEFTCYDYYENLENITIVLKTNHKVLSSNAHAVEDNKYMWVLTKDGEKNIEFSYEKKNIKETNSLTISLVVALVLVVGVVSLYIYRKSKENNKI